MKNHMYSIRRPAHKKQRQHPSGWIVTFADMMALLLTFFIILSSISTADEDKYKAVSESMEKAFGTGGEQNLKGQVIKQDDVDGSKQADFTKPPSIEAQPENKSGSEDPSQEKFNMIRMKTVTKLLAKEIQQGTVQVEIKNSSVVMRFPERVAFPSGSDELNNSFNPAIENLVKVLIKLPGEVTISGHTDNRPIDTFRFRSNWELSSARAISVLHALLDKKALNKKELNKETQGKTGLKAERFTVQGHADTHPLKNNNSAENRAENRRVEISIQVPNEGHGKKQSEDLNKIQRKEKEQKQNKVSLNKKIERTKKESPTIFTNKVIAL